MKKYFLYSALVALALVGCDYNEDNFEGFDDFGKPTDVKKGFIRIYGLGIFEWQSKNK